MIALDTNVLLYGYNIHSPFHTAARQHLDKLFSAAEPVGIPLPCLHGFLRIATHPAFDTINLPIEDALSLIQIWLDQPAVQILYPGAQHWPILNKLSRTVQAHGNLVADVAIAAIALEYDAVVHTNDRDFTRFPGVPWFNPFTAYNR